MCTQRRHDFQKSDRKVYEATTTPGGWQPDVDRIEELELRHCFFCHSTLSDGTTRTLRTEHVLQAVA